MASAEAPPTEALSSIVFDQFLHWQATLLWQAAICSVTLVPSPDDSLLHAYLEEALKHKLLLLR